MEEISWFSEKICKLELWGVQRRIDKNARGDWEGGALGYLVVIIEKLNDGNRRNNISVIRKT